MNRAENFSRYFFFIIIADIVLNTSVIVFDVFKVLSAAVILIFLKEVTVAILIYIMTGRDMTCVITYILIIIYITTRLIFSVGIPKLYSERLDNSSETFTGVVDTRTKINSETYYDNYDLFECRILEDQVLPLKKKMIVKTSFGKILLIGSDTDVKHGSKILVTAKLSKFSPQRNPGGFDEKAYYARSGIFLKGFVSQISSFDKRFILSPYRILHYIKTKLIITLYKYLPSEHAGLACAVMLGETSGLDSEVKEDMNIAGISHLNAVSGTALFYIILPLRKIIKSLKIKFRTSNIIILTALLLLGSMFDWSSSISRAVFVSLCWQISSLFKRKTGPFNILCFASCSILIFSPLYSLQPGFWFSVFACYGILSAGEKMTETIANRTALPEVICRIAGTSVIASVSVMPLQIIYSGGFSLFGIISNIIIIPVFSILIPYGLIYSAIFSIFTQKTLNSIFSLPLRGMLDWILKAAEKIGNMELVYYEAGRFVFGAVCGSMILALLCFGRIRYSKKLISLLAVILFALSAFANSISGETRKGIEIIFADVGQGDATIIITESGETLIIDSGEEKYGYSAVCGILKHYNVKPDHYFATHCHSDHCGGLLGLMRDYGGENLYVPVGTLINKRTPSTGSGFGESDMTVELLDTADKEGVAVSEIRAGENLYFDNDKLMIEVLSPERSLGVVTHDLNELSLILMVRYRDLEVLICGDATAENENLLVSTGNIIKADIYRISHHGSPRSTGDDIINAVSAEIAVISVGYNSYGHPSDKVISRLAESGAEVLRTDHNGAVIIRYNGNKAAIKTMIP